MIKGLELSKEVKENTKAKIFPFNSIETFIFEEPFLLPFGKKNPQKTLDP